MVMSCSKSTIPLYMDVSTLYGEGRVIEYRTNDGMYVVELDEWNATVFCTQESLMELQGVAGGKSSSSSNAGSQNGSVVGMLVGEDAAASDGEEGCAESDTPAASVSTASSMELNVAYEALETMRRLNLEVQCQEAGVVCSDYTQCTQCLLAGKLGSSSSSSPSFPRIRKFLNDHPGSGSSEGKPTNFPRIRRLLQEQDQKKQQQQTSSTTTSTTTTSSSSSISKLLSTSTPKLKRPTTPCLLCGAPTCSTHASSSFKSQSITICTSCVQLFAVNDFVQTHCLQPSNDHQREAQVHRMMDLYDRALLLLRYSQPYLQQTADALEQNTQLNNKVGVAGSSVGIVSGALGIAAAATLLTPAGPPLLIASLVFGGSATAVQTGTEAVHYFSEPNQMANRMMALHGLLQSVIHAANAMREAVLQDEDVSYVDPTSGTRKQAKLSHWMTETQKRTILAAGTQVGRNLSMATVTEMGTLGAANARFVARAGTGVARGARFARFAGGTLSAATILLEMNQLSTTIQSMREGSPCEKAKVLRSIQKALEREEFPKTEELEKELQGYLVGLEVMAECRRMAEEGEAALEEIKREEEEEKQQEAEAAAAAGQHQKQQKQPMEEVDATNQGSKSNPKLNSKSSLTSSFMQIFEDAQSMEKGKPDTGTSLWTPLLSSLHRQGSKEEAEAVDKKDTGSDDTHTDADADDGIDTGAVTAKEEPSQTQRQTMSAKSSSSSIMQKFHQATTNLTSSTSSTATTLASSTTTTTSSSSLSFTTTAQNTLSEKWHKATTKMEQVTTRIEQGPLLSSLRYTSTSAPAAAADGDTNEDEHENEDQGEEKKEGVPRRSLMQRIQDATSNSSTTTAASSTTVSMSNETHELQLQESKSTSSTDTDTDGTSAASSSKEEPKKKPQVQVQVQVQPQEEAAPKKPFYWLEQQNNSQPFQEEPQSSSSSSSKRLFQKLQEVTTTATTAGALGAKKMETGMSSLGSSMFSRSMGWGSRGDDDAATTAAGETATATKTTTTSAVGSPKRTVSQSDSTASTPQNQKSQSQSPSPSHTAPSVMMEKMKLKASSSPLLERMHMPKSQKSKEATVLQEMGGKVKPSISTTAGPQEIVFDT